jgi:hypothetical protein
MSGKVDKTKLFSAVNSVGNGRMSGVGAGARLNVTGGEAPASAPEPKPAPGVPVEAPIIEREPESKRTQRLGFHCTPAEKKALKQLALDNDTSVSELVHEALLAKGYLKA